MKQRVSAVARGEVVKFEGLLVRGGQGGDANAVRKWLEVHQRKGPWVCKVCNESVGAEGERVVVFVDLADSDYFEIVHRQHAD
jgi:hypothetical protein